MLELCDGGSLRRYLHGRREGLPDAEVRELACQLGSALQQLHGQGIAHRSALSRLSARNHQRGGRTPLILKRGGGANRRV